MVRQTPSTRPRSLNSHGILGGRELSYIPRDPCSRSFRHPFEGRSFTYLPSCFARLVDIVQQILFFAVNSQVSLFLITYPYITSFVVYSLPHSL
jgi:hypothetical protein